MCDDCMDLSDADLGRTHRMGDLPHETDSLLFALSSNGDLLKEAGVTQVMCDDCADLDDADIGRTLRAPLNGDVWNEMVALQKQIEELQRSHIELSQQVLQERDSRKEFERNLTWQMLNSISDVRQELGAGAPRVSNWPLSDAMRAELIGEPTESVCLEASCETEASPQPAGLCVPRVSDMLAPDARLFHVEKAQSSSEMEGRPSMFPWDRPSASTLGEARPSVPSFRPSVGGLVSARPSVGVIEEELAIQRAASLAMTRDVPLQSAGRPSVPSFGRPSVSFLERVSVASSAPSTQLSVPSLRPSLAPAAEGIVKVEISQQLREMEERWEKMKVETIGLKFQFKEDSLRNADFSSYHR